MPEDYLALSAAVRRPLRRWWLRTGVWWLAALGISLAWRIYEAWLMSQAIAQYAQVLSPRYHSLVSHVLGLVLTPGAGIVWALAALHANRLLTDLLHSAALADSPRYLPTRFALAMQQGVVPVTACVIYYLISGSAFWYWWAVSVSDRPNLWHMEYSAIMEVLQFIATMLWFLAFIAIVHARPKLLWCWFAAVNVLSPILFIGISILDMLGVSSTTGSLASLDIYGEWSWAIGLLVLGTMLAAFRARRWLQAYVMYGFVLLSGVIDSVFSAAMKLETTAQWLPPVVKGVVPVLVDWRWIYRFLPWGMNPTAMSQRMYQTGAKIWLLQPEWVIVRGHESLVLLALALNALWLAALYALIRHVILQPARDAE